MTLRHDCDMASIHKDPRGRSPFYYCAYTLPGGRRVLKSTKQTNKSVAKEFCLKLQRTANKAAKQQFGEAQARKLLNEILEVIGEDQMNLQTVEEFVGVWLKSKEHAKAEGTTQRYRDALEPFLESLGSRARVSLPNLAMRDVTKFVGVSQQNCLANKTINFRLKTLRSVLESAKRQGLVQVNVAHEVPMLPDTSAEKGTFSPEELQSLLRAASLEWKGVILAGLTAGLRIGDAALLRWEDIECTWDDPDPPRFIRLVRQKRLRSAAAKVHEVPLLPDFEVYLAARRREGANTSGPLFPSLSAKTVRGNAGLSNTFSRLIAIAGIANPAITKATGGKSRTVYRLSFHALKHTYVTLLATMGVSREIRMKLAGHTSSVHDRYTHFELKTLSDSVKNFPRVVED